MSIGRRSFLKFSLTGLAAAVFPEVARAATALGPAVAVDTPWQWQAREAREMTEKERAKYAALFESDLREAEAQLGARSLLSTPSMSISQGGASTVLAFGIPLGTSQIYARHVELSPGGKVTRAATTTFFASEADQSLVLHSIGTDARTAAISRTQFEARAACPSGTRSCRTCSTHNTAGLLTCCAGCAWASGNFVALLSCVLILCSICASQNCTRWTYACCPN